MEERSRCIVITGGTAIRVMIDREQGARIDRSKSESFSPSFEIFRADLFNFSSRIIDERCCRYATYLPTYLPTLPTLPTYSPFRTVARNSLGGWRRKEGGGGGGHHCPPVFEHPRSAYSVTL